MPGGPSDPDSLPQRLPALLGLAVVLAAYAWMLTWSNWFLYTYFTAHFLDNFRVLAAFYTLLGTIRFNVLTANARDAAWAVAVFGSALALGRIVLDALRLDLETDWGRDLRALAVGLGTLSVALLLLGLAGLWIKPVMIGLILLPLAAGSVMNGAAFIQRVRSVELLRRLNELSKPEIIGFALLGSYLVLNLMSALGPEYFYDSLVYHLALPKLYLLHHRIVATPSMIYSGAPLATEMLYGLGLSLGTDALAKLIHFGFGLATAAAIYGWCQKHANRKAAIFAVLLFYSAPMVCFASSVAKTELAVAFYLLLAALLLVETLEREDAAAGMKPYILAGALAGMTFGTKYNAGLYLPVLVLPLAYRRLRTGSGEVRSLIKQLALFFGSAALVSSPWLVKNWLFYHNPTYPFFNGLFGGPAANVAGLSGDAHARDLVSAFTTSAGFKNLVTGVWDPLGQRMDSHVGPALLIGMPWLFLVRWKRTKDHALVLILAGLWLAWALHTSLARFFLPAVPIYCILIAVALWLSDVPRPLRLLFLGIFHYTIAISMARTFLMLSQSGAWKAAYGRVTKVEYLSHEHPAYNAPYYAGAAFINETLSKDAVVLFIGEERGYYCERKFITASVFDVNPMQTLADASADPGDLLARLKREGVSHLLVNAGSEHYQRWLAGMSVSGLKQYQGLLSGKAGLIFEHKQDAVTDRSWIQIYKLQDF